MNYELLGAKVVKIYDLAKYYIQIKIFLRFFLCSRRICGRCPRIKRHGCNFEDTDLACTASSPTSKLRSLYAANTHKKSHQKQTFCDFSCVFAFFVVTLHRFSTIVSGDQHRVRKINMTNGVTRSIFCGSNSSVYYSYLTH